MNIADNICKGMKALRKELGLKQTELAKSLDIVSSYISDIEAGKKTPGIEVIIKLHERYNVNFNYLFTGQGGMFYNKNNEINLDSRRQELGDEMLTQIQDLLWFMENITSARFAIINFFRTYKFENRKMLEMEKMELLEKQKAGKDN